MSGNLKQATLKKFGFTRRVEHRGEDIDVQIPDYVDNFKKLPIKLRPQGCLASCLIFDQF